MKHVPLQPVPATNRDDASHAARSGFIQLLAMFGQGLLFVYQLVVSRLFGATVYGLFMSVLGFLEVVSRAGQLGGDAGMLRFVAAHRIAGETELETRALGTGLRVGLIATGVLALALGVLSGRLAAIQDHPDMAILLRVMAPAAVATAATMILVEALLAAKAARYNLYVRGLAEPGLLFVATVGAAVAGGGVRRLGTAYLVATVLTLACAIAAAARVFGGHRLLASLTSRRHPHFFRFAWPLGACEMMNATQHRADIILLGFFVAPADIGLYAAAELLGRGIAGMRYAFDGVASPILSEAFATGDRARLRYNLALMTRWVLTAAAPICALIVALRPELLGLFGQHFTGGVAAFVLLSLSHLLNAGLGLTPWVIVMSGRSRLMFWNNLGSTTLSVALILLLAPRLGLAGAATATRVSVAAFQVACLVEAWHLERVHPFTRGLVKPLVAALGTFSVCTLLRSGLHRGPLRVGLMMGLGLATYIVLLLVLGLPPEERDILSQFLRRKRNAAVVS
jgi:O-antigen/teichoic acid export membrane protein